MKDFNTVNKLIKKNIFLILFLTILGCKAQNCKDKNLQGKSYREIIKVLKQTDFKVSEKVYTDSSWIKSIKFYSCNEITGFLILTSKQNKQYVHNKVPLNLWNQFKKANSYGRFYNTYIKKRFKY